MEGGSTPEIQSCNRSLTRRTESTTVKFRTKQQRIFAEIDQKLHRLKSLAPECPFGNPKLIPELMDAMRVGNRPAPMSECATRE